MGGEAPEDVGGLTAVLSAKGPLAGPSVLGHAAGFVARLQSVLNETSGMADPGAALHKLREAQAGIPGLMANMTARQKQLSHESEEQDQGLLVGVLMTRQHASM